MTTIELLRHAQAESRGRWWGHPDRPLSDAGHQQAKRLARDLDAGGAIDALYASPAVRCMQTLQPLADVLGGAVQPDAALAEAAVLPVVGEAWMGTAWLGGRALGFLERVVELHAGGRVVVCSHGDVIPAVMAVLAGRDGLALPDLRLPTGGRLTLVFVDGRCVRAVPAPAPAG